MKLDRQGSQLVINESGLYILILRSRDAMTPGTAAHRFRKWVTATVLPSIRRTNTFTAKADDAHLNAIAKLINSQHRATAEQRAAIEALVARKFVELGIPATTFRSPQGELAGV